MGSKENQDWKDRPPKMPQRQLYPAKRKIYELSQQAREINDKLLFKQIIGTKKKERDSFLTA